MCTQHSGKEHMSNAQWGQTAVVVGSLECGDGGPWKDGSSSAQF